MGTQKDSINTKLKLIEVAGILFAQNGYTQVTVRDIIEEAGTNLGALNYHFGTKECLYGEVLRVACERDRLDLDPIESLSSREKLAYIISEALTVCVKSLEENWHYLLIKRECQFPTHLFDTLAEQHFTHQSAIVAGLISDISGRPADVAEVELGVATMVGLLDMFGLNQHLITKVMPDLTPHLEDRDVLTERILRLVIEAANQRI